jgi:predicted nucleic acid-binding protein
LSRTVVADAGPLIAFGRVGRLDLLAAVLGEVLVPEAVLAECLTDDSRPGALAIRDAAAQGLLGRVADQDPSCPALPLLDKGESAAIRLAIERSVPVLMDEKTGRRVATDLGVRVIGSAGVLLAAKKLRLIDSVAPLLESFARQGYHLSPALIRAVLERAQEP